MAGHLRHNSGDLEEQLRQMMLSNASPPSAGLFDPDANDGSSPAVRLPPTSSYAPTVRLPPLNNNTQSPPASRVLPPHLRHQQQPQQNFNGPQGPARHHSNNSGGHSPHFISPQPFGRQQRGGQQYAHHPAQQNYRPQNGYGPGPNGPFGSPSPQQQRARNQQQMQLDPNAFQRGGFDRPPMGRGQRSQQLFNPHDPRTSMPSPREQQHIQQTQYLESVAATQISKVDMSPAEYQEKEAFRVALENILHKVCDENPDRLPKISLEPFGSFKSGFASAGSDMDLVIVVKDRSATSACFSLLEDDLPRVLERRLLELGLGARLLTRTRVPIIKVCEKPEGEFLEKLREERQKWDVLPDEEKYPHLFPETAHEGQAEEHEQDLVIAEGTHPTGQNGSIPQLAGNGETSNVGRREPANGVRGEHEPKDEVTASTPNGETKATPKQRRDDSKPWTRERKAGPLDFPKHGVGIQSDINFFNPLGLHNTQLLRCYSLCDPRVRPMILFVKAWAKQRKINSSYSGTLSSYGYVLMVLHYLVNVSSPPVLPNLQADRTPHGNFLPEGEDVDGWHVRFWRDELAITTAAQHGQLTQNSEPLGSLLAGFFHYFSSLPGGGNPHAHFGRNSSFHWMQQTLSLRTPGGVLTKEEKGWVKAITEESEGKRVQHRYLFCIEDPFELAHNVARTVTHKGIVAIRDEFRRAHRILMGVGAGYEAKGLVDGELFDELVEAEELQKVDGIGVAAGGSVDGAAERGKVDGLQPHVLGRQHHANGHPPFTPPRGGRAQNGGAAHQQQQGRAQQMKSQINVHDNSAFPTLAASPKAAAPDSVPKKKKVSQKKREQDRGEVVRDVGDDFSEVSGEKARAILEEVKRKRDEAAAESTAILAAESVLQGID